MKKITLWYLVLVFPFLACQTKTKEKTPAPGYLMETQLFEFYNHFWLNLHHFLYNKAVVFAKKKEKEAISTSIWEQMNTTEKETLTSALTFYSNSLIQEDLRTGDYLAAFKGWIILQRAQSNLPSDKVFEQQINVLNDVRIIYEKYWWQEHQKTNLQALTANKSLIEKLELLAKIQLEQLTQAEWQSQKIRVDICYYAKLGRPYTSINPTHIVMNVKRNAKPTGNWFELLFHEASHHFIFPSSGLVGETINQAVEELGIKAPRGLWHGYLFYFTGKVSQELLIKEGIENYELYMVRRKVFDWFAPLLEKHLPAYLNGTQSLLECTKQIIIDADKATSPSN